MQSAKQSLLSINKCMILHARYSALLPPCFCVNPKRTSGGLCPLRAKKIAFFFFFFFIGDVFLDGEEN